MNVNEKPVLSNDMKMVLLNTCYTLPTVFFAKSDMRKVFPSLTPTEVLIYSYEYNNIFLPFSNIYEDERGCKYIHIDYDDLADRFNVTRYSAKKACEGLVEKGLFIIKPNMPNRGLYIYLRDIASFAYDN